jgi:hypothetical protein
MPKFSVKSACLLLSLVFFWAPLPASSQIRVPRPQLPQIQIGRPKPPVGAKSPAEKQPGSPLAGLTGDSEMMVMSRPSGGQGGTLETEFQVNGETVNIYTENSARADSLEQHLKSGWNTITIKTKAQPVNRHERMTLSVGPARKEKDQILMKPILWFFENDTDWTFRNGRYTHRLGPDVQEITATYTVYYTGDFQPEIVEMKAGDFVLTNFRQQQENSPVTATVFINGTPLNSFTKYGLVERRVVVTPWLKQGRNEITLISTRAENVVGYPDSDIQFSLSGPAEWNVSRGQYEVREVLKFGSMQGWSMDPRSGRLINREKPDSNAVERIIPFVLKDAPAKASVATPPQAEVRPAPLAGPAQALPASASASAQSPSGSCPAPSTASAAPPRGFRLLQRAPVAFVPFTDTRPQGAPDKEITLPNGKRMMYSCYLLQLNDLEKKFNAIGHSLKDTSQPDVEVGEPSVDPAVLKK